MAISKEKMWRAAERALKRTEEYQEQRELGTDENYEVLYILAKGRKQNPVDVRAYAGYEDTAISFHPFKEDEVTHNWDFNFDGDLFEDLESGYELMGMTLDCHYGVWCTIEAWKDGDIDNQKGMQKYLGYCKRNGITKEKLRTESGYSGMDVMQLYDPKADRAKSNKEQER